MHCFIKESDEPASEVRAAGTHASARLLPRSLWDELHDTPAG